VLVQLASGANILRLTRGAPRADATMQSTKFDRRKTDHSTAGTNCARPRAAGETTCGAVGGTEGASISHRAAYTALEAAFPIARAASGAAVVGIHIRKGPYHVPGSVL